ncbi:MAG: gfo/Idh/MocA family oxidoreductase, partial [Pirellulales bacterium]
VTGSGYKIYDMDGKTMSEGAVKTDDASHIGNFLTSVREAGRPNAEIEEGVKSTQLCHLGNIAYRTGRTVRFDPQAKRIVGDEEQLALWGREYRPGWEPVV